MKLCSKFVIASILTGFAMLSAVQAQEKKMKREELPPRDGGTKLRRRTAQYV